MEICVDCVTSAVNAKNGGASRVELCANLTEGGTTPSIGMFRVVKKTLGSDFPVYVMIRPRGGDFLYSQWELDVMKEDLQELKHAGADGFVIGILKKDGTIDKENCSILIALAGSKPITFHRAVDMTADISGAVEDIISLGCSRILTSGGESSVLEGSFTIKKMIEQANGRIIIVPGGGISERNLARILTETGATEFHASARSTLCSEMHHQKAGISMGASFSPPEFSIKVTDLNKVNRMVEISRHVITR